MSRVLLSLSLFTVVATALVGCAAITQAFHHEVDRTFTDVHDMGNWVGDADWVPADATNVRVHSTVNGMTAVVRVTSHSALTGCTATARASLWSFAPSWVPSTAPDTVFACGAWSVIPVDGGYFGWTASATDADPAAQK